MATVFTWLVVAVILLAILNFVILPILIFVLKLITAFVEAFSPRRATGATRPSTPGPTSPLKGPPPAPATQTVTPPSSEMPFNPELEFGRWGRTIIPYTTSLSELMSQFKPALASDDEAALCRTASAIATTLDRMETDLIAPPNPQAAYHWSAMILLLRKSCYATIEGVASTRNLLTASQLLAQATEEMDALVQIMNEWSAKCEAGEFS